MASHATLLVHPMSHAEICISSDASDVGVRAVLEQHHGQWLPLGFYSQSLSSTERWDLWQGAVWKFQVMAEGRCCTWVTDQTPLAQAFMIASDPWSPQQQHHLSAIAETIQDILHQPDLRMLWLISSPTLLHVAFPLVLSTQTCYPLINTCWALHFDGVTQFITLS